MGKLIDGKWEKRSIVTSDEKGRYNRLKRTFRDEISQTGTFKPEKNRYHLYVSYACPWAHRTLIYRELKGLQDVISVSVVHPDLLENGWFFDDSYPGSTIDHLCNAQFLYENYQRADKTVTTSVTVPVLWDKNNNTIVNNESSEIIRMFNTCFDQLTGNSEDFYPQHLQSEIDHFNEIIYEPVNNGVYKTGFAKTQQAYEQAVQQLFSTLDFLDQHLEGKNYLVGDCLTEADIRLIPTLLRFDSVYVTHFKCNIKRIKDHKNLSRYTKMLYKVPAIGYTTNFDHIKRHYYYSHKMINPYRIVPLGPTEPF